MATCSNLSQLAQQESSRSGIPAWVYLGLAATESGCTGYGNSSGVGFFGIGGSGPAGSYQSNPQPGEAPISLALYQTPQQAFAALTSLLVTKYPRAVAQAQQGNVNGYLAGLTNNGQGGYASAQDIANGWLNLQVSAIDANGGPGGGGVNIGGIPVVGGILQNLTIGGIPVGQIGSDAANAAVYGTGNPIVDAWNSLKAQAINGAEAAGIFALGGIVLVAGLLILAWPQAEAAAVGAATGGTGGALAGAATATNRSAGKVAGGLLGRRNRRSSNERERSAPRARREPAGPMTQEELRAYVRNNPDKVRARKSA